MRRDNTEGSAASEVGAMLSATGSPSVVIPAFNEEQRIASTLTAVRDYLGNTAESFEIVVKDEITRSLLIL